MTVKRLNEAPILDQVEGHYEKFLLLLLHKFHPDGITVSLEDVVGLVKETTAADPLVLFTHGHKESIDFKAMRASDAQRIAKHVEGLTSRRSQREIQSG